jgi:hypothetical protein
MPGCDNGGGALGAPGTDGNAGLAGGAVNVTLRLVVVVGPSGAVSPGSGGSELAPFAVAAVFAVAGTIGNGLALLEFGWAAAVEVLKPGDRVAEPAGPAGAPVVAAVVGPVVAPAVVGQTGCGAFCLAITGCAMPL